MDTYPQSTSSKINNDHHESRTEDFDTKSVERSDELRLDGLETADARVPRDIPAESNDDENIPERGCVEPFENPNGFEIDVTNNNRDVLDGSLR